MRADFHRLEGWSECNGIRAEAGRNGDSTFPLCRLLVAAGVPDAPLEFHEMTITLTDAQVARILDALDMLADDDRDADDEHEVEETYALMTYILQQRGE